MPRPVTLFTGQWADLPIAELAPKVREMGYDGVELACWGDHFLVGKSLADEGAISEKWELLEKNGLTCYSISNHLVGQAVCDPIDERHKAILSKEIYGDGDPDGIRERGGGNEEDRPGCPEILRRETRGRTGAGRGERVYGFPDLASPVLLSAGGAGAA